MAYQEETDGINSKFNAGILQMQRIHELQRRLNMLNQNLFSFNPDFNSYNYELALKTNNSLFQEVASKLKAVELKIGLRFKKFVEESIKKYPILEEKIKDGIGSTGRTLVQNKEYLKVTEDCLFQYEMLIRQFLESHKLNSPPEDESALF